MKIKSVSVFLILMYSMLVGCSSKNVVYYVGSTENDLYDLLGQVDLEVRLSPTLEDAVKKSTEGIGIIKVSDNYPQKEQGVSDELYQAIKEKNLKLYIEYPEDFPGIELGKNVLQTNYERGVITADVFGASLTRMDIIGLNDCHFLETKEKEPLIVLAKVAGFDHAAYGLEETDDYPLLFHKENALIATTKLSNYRTGRYGPNDSWQAVWKYILTWVSSDKELKVPELKSEVSPMFSKEEPLPESASTEAVKKGVEWFYNGRFFIHSDWAESWWQKYQGDGTEPWGPPLDQALPNGDGSLGILEGHASTIYHDGDQLYRYWLRADVQGEVAYAMAAAGNLLKKPAYNDVATKLLDMVYFNSVFSAGLKSDKESDVYGLLGWSHTHPWVFYGDDNARFLLGAIGASAYLGSDKWDEKIAETILANFRTTGKLGFRSGRLEEKPIIEAGIEELQNRELVNPHPHFESWLWACYLWLYDKTNYEPLLEKTKTAIQITMEAYPDRWNWTNGIQQERARMILPLAWLVRVEDTPKHRAWLDQIVGEVLDNQVACGAIREELGAGPGQFGRTNSNKAYGTTEAPLIFENGDPVADMLYTVNFAFFGLNEAAEATGDPKYKEAVDKMADFLIRIQVQSEKHKDVGGAWFRAFDYNRWDYWASNADHGWGAWSTLTGWIQSWIVATQVSVQNESSFWQATSHSSINEHMDEVVNRMMN